VPAALALLAMAAGAPPARASVVEEIVAHINNRIVTASELEERKDVLRRQIAQQSSGASAEADLQSAMDSLLANIITENLLLERADTVFDMDRIRGTLMDDFRKQQKINTDAELEQALKDQGMTRKELESQLIRLAVPNEIINYDVKRRISVSESEIQEYYTRHMNQWETPATVTFREIVLLYGADNRNAVLERAQQVAKEARDGTDFLELVQRDSEAGTREAQGLIGPVPLSDLQSIIAVSAFSLDPGEISNPLDTGHSFHVIRLDARTDKIVKTVADVHDDVEKAVRDEKFRPRFDRYLKKLWKNNYIEVSPKYESMLVVSPLTPKTPS
jgi:peptidyl-prolyl cis-trans isomerase SurA